MPGPVDVLAGAALEAGLKEYRKRVWKIPDGERKTPKEFKELRAQQKAEKEARKTEEASKNRKEQGLDSPRDNQ